MGDFWEKALRGLMDAMEGLLHADVNQRALRGVGVKIGREAVLEYRRSHKVQRPFSKKNYVSCMEYLGKCWGFGYREVESGKDYIIFRASTCPFKNVGLDHPNVCAIESGIFGGIAGDEFGCARVYREETRPPRNCHIVVYTNRKNRNVPAEAPVYPEDPAAGYALADDQIAGLPLKVLSRREREVLRCVGEGLADKEIAEALHISVRTAQGHVAGIRKKLGTSRRADLIRYALLHKMVTI